MLSCDCDYYPEDPGDVVWFPPADFTMLQTSKRKRCKSCKRLINIGEECLEFKKERVPYSEIEERIYGDMVQIASFYMCKECGEIFLNLDALGYCLDITQPMADHLSEYHEITGFKPMEGE